MQRWWLVLRKRLQAPRSRSDGTPTLMTLVLVSCSLSLVFALGIRLLLSHNVLAMLATCSWHISTLSQDLSRRVEPTLASVLSSRRRVRRQ